MHGTHTDLAYLGRFCKEDRSRMERYVHMYLEGAPALFHDLVARLEAGDAEGLAVAAHSLRPQVNYMGAQRVFDLLTKVETEARAQGTAACRAMVNECVDLNAKVMDDLRAWLGEGGPGALPQNR
jgi:HPt (histidine-containing phosphotransfer) domain-containing protein